MDRSPPGNVLRRRRRRVASADRVARQGHSPHRSGDGRDRRQTRSAQCKGNQGKGSAQGLDESVVRVPPGRTGCIELLREDTLRFVDCRFR